MCGRRSNPQYRSLTRRSSRSGTGHPGCHELPFIHARMPSGRRVIVDDVLGSRRPPMTGVWDATAIRIELARTDERARRTWSSVPASAQRH